MDAFYSRDKGKEQLRGIIYMEVTIKQIAEIAGVHRSTVDKVLHNREGVSDQVRQRIQTIIDELGYKPNVIGKALTFQKRPLLVAVILLNVDALTELKQGIEEAYSEYSNYGLKVEYYYTNSDDEKEQASVLGFLAEKNIAGIIIHPINHPSIKDKINNFVDMNIPVVTMNTDLNDCKRLCFLGQDMVAAGRVAGELMGQILNGRGKVAILTGSDSLLSSKEREKAFEDIISECYPEIDIIDVIETYEAKNRAFQSTLELLRRENDLRGIYVTSGSVGEIGKAIKLEGRHKDIKVITFDVYPEIVNLIKEGVINFTIGQELQLQGYKALKTLFEFLFYNREPQNDHIKTAIQIRLKENIDI